MSPHPRAKRSRAKRKRTSSSPIAGESSSMIDEFPSRCCDHLFAQDVTVHCALNELCVPCAYKIGCFDVALDTCFTKTVPNQRPELCPRASALSVFPSEGTLGYRSGMSVLTVGDGDFSFSLALARLLHKGTSPSMDGRVIATSYESHETLLRVYPAFGETLSELDALGARLEYEVDATRLPETLHVLSDTEAQLRFHRIVWNFPCTAISHGQDGQNSAMEDNKRLVRRFVQGARHLLHDNGEIHMSHKTKPPFNQWQLEEVAIENCKGDPAVTYCGRIVLDKFTLKPYTPRKALDRKSFPCHDACFYVFRVAKHTGHARFNVSDSFPSSIPNNSRNADARADGNEQSATLTSIVPVTKEVIATIRDAHLVKDLKRSKGSTARKKKKIKH